MDKCEYCGKLFAGKNSHKNGPGDTVCPDCAKLDNPAKDAVRESEWNDPYDV